VQAELDACPAFIQSRLQKQADVRINVVGTNQFGARAAATGQHIDWRRENTAEWQPWNVPPSVRSFIEKMMMHFELTFAAIDFVETSDGEVFFLEVNPNGQWLWLQAATNDDIAAAIADELTSLDLEAYVRSPGLAGHTAGT
jgi:glutathione synthase/RimK-type ligase-like ATP-grasp enzyme